MANEGTYYGVGLDVSGVRKDGQVVIDEFNKIGTAADSAGKKVDAPFKQMKYHVYTLEEAFKDSRDNFTGTFNELKQAITSAKATLQQLKLQYRDTLEAVNKTGDSGMSKALKEIKAEIDLQEASISGLEARYKEMAGDVMPRFTTQIRTVSNEMMRLAAEGRQNSQEYQELEAKMRKLVEVQRQFSIERRNMLA